MQDRLEQFLAAYSSNPGFQEAENRPLTTYRVNPGRETHKFGTREIIEDEVFGAVRGQFVFQRQRLRHGYRRAISTEWYLTSEGPIYWIRHWRLNPTDSAQLLLGVHLTDYPEMGMDYSYNGQTGIKSSAGMGYFADFMPFKPRFPDGRKIEEKDARAGGRYFVSAPRQIDSLLWLPRVEDKEDKVIFDRTLPWRQWFEQIGIEVLPRPMMPHESYFD